MLSFIPIFFVRARESNQTIFLHIHLPTVSVQCNGVQHPRHCPPMSSYAPSKLPPMSSYAPLQLSTTGVSGSYRRRHRLTLLPSWRGCLQDIYICSNWITEEYHQQGSTQQFHTPSRWPRRLSIEHPCHQGLQKQPTLNTQDIIGSEVCCIKSVATPTKL